MACAKDRERLSFPLLTNVTWLLHALSTWDRDWLCLLTPRVPQRVIRGGSLSDLRRPDWMEGFGRTQARLPWSGRCRRERYEHE